jgi:Domain of unknown function (DUF4375)
VLGLFRKRSTATLRVPQLVVTAESLQDGASPYTFAHDVHKYVTVALLHAHYRPEEIPEEGLWIYFASYYIGQVPNGGHSQYLHNSSRKIAQRELALRGLQLIGARNAEVCLKEMLKWAAANKAEANRQDGFQVRSGALDQLDSKFYAAKAAEEFYSKLNDWGKKSKTIRTVPAVKLPDEFGPMVAGNPSFDERKREAVIKVLNTALTAHYLGHFIYTLSSVRSATGIPIELMGLGAGRFGMNPLDAKEPVWTLKTTAGDFEGFMSHEFVVVVEPGGTDRKPISKRKNIAIEGRMLADAAIKLHKTLAPAACADELLARLSSRPRLRNLWSLGFQPHPPKGGPQFNFEVRTENGPSYSMTVSSQTACLMELGTDRPIAKIEGRELQGLQAKYSRLMTEEPVL